MGLGFVPLEAWMPTRAYMDVFTACTKPEPITLMTLAYV